MTSLSLGVECGGVGVGARIEPDHRVDRGAIVIVRSDSGEIRTGQFYGRDATTRHRVLQFGDRFLRRVKASRGPRLRVERLRRKE